MDGKAIVRSFRKQFALGLYNINFDSLISEIDVALANKDQCIAALQDESCRLKSFAAGHGMASEAADTGEVAVLVVGLHERVATLTDERDEWEHRHAQVQTRVEALEADLRALVEAIRMEVSNHAFIRSSCQCALCVLIETPHIKAVLK